MAHKCLGEFFFNKRMNAASLESYNEAVSIFEWCLDNNLSSKTKFGDIIQCYIHLIDLEEEKTGPISESRGALCYKLGNCYVQVDKHEGKL